MKNITFGEIEKMLFGGAKMQVSEEQLAGMERCYEFLKEFAAEKVIYGINTGFGPMAQWRVDDRYLSDLQYNIIRSHSTGAGEPLGDLYVKGAMIARLTNLLQGRSGVHPSVALLLQEFINRGIHPYIPEHGSVGASGDLVQLAHIALTLIGEGKVHYRGEWRETKDVMRECGLEPLKIYIREGLSITNGTSVMTGISAVNQHYAERLLELSLLTAVWMNEVAASYDDWMADELNSVRRHEGQRYTAQRMRELAKGSQCLSKREHHLYSEEQKGKSYFEHKVQAYYSLRCTPQILGPVWETLQNSRRVIEEEFNSASDNPIVDPDSKNVYHGGNFHGDYISLEADKVKIAVTRLALPRPHQRHPAAVPEHGHPGPELRHAGLPVHGDEHHSRVPDAVDAQLRAHHSQQQRQPGHRQHGHQQRPAVPQGDRQRLPGDGHPHDSPAPGDGHTEEGRQAEPRHKGHVRQGERHSAGLRRRHAVLRRDCQGGGDAEKLKH